MGFTGEQSTILSRYLAAGAGGLLLDAVLFAALTALLPAAIPPLTPRLAAAALATLALWAAGRCFVFGGRPMPKSDRGQDIPFGLLCVAGAALSVTIFARVLPAMPQPAGLFAATVALLAGNVACLACNYFLLHSMLPAREKKPGGGLAPRTVWRGLVWVLFLLVASAPLLEHLRGLAAFPAHPLPLEPSSPDSWLRLVQVRQWVTGGEFFDHTVYRAGGAETVTTHWTRPMDALVAFFYALTPGAQGIDLRLMLAAAWLPLVLCAGLFYAVTRAARESFDSLHALGLAAFLLLFSVYDFAAPGNVDHHLLLAVLWSGTVWLLLKDRLSPGQAAGLGAIAGLMIWVSTEAVVFTGLVFAVMGFDALARPEKAKTLLFAATGALLTVIAALSVEIPAHEVLARVQYDTVSIVHAALLLLTAIGAIIMTAAFRMNPRPAQRFAIAVLCGGGVLLGQFLLYPAFYQGPLADTDASILKDLLATVNEAKPLFGREPALAVKVLMPPALAAYLLTAAYHQKNLRRERKRKLVILSALLAACFIMTILQVRWGHYLQPVAVIAIAALLPGLAVAGRGEAGRWLRTTPRRLRPYVALICIYLITSLAVRAAPAETPAKSWCVPQLRHAIQTQQLQEHLGDKATLYAPADAGAEILFFTPYSIIAGNYHREAKGLRALAQISAAKTPEKARPVLREYNVDALLFCPQSAAVPEGSWLRDMKKLPKWLAPAGTLSFMDLPGDKPVFLRVKKKP